MTRRAVAVLVSLAALVSAAPAPAQTAALSRAQEGAFPNRSFVLTLPRAEKIAPSRVAVRENGRPVAGLSVLPASEAGGRQLAVVLVIDTSRSMSGRPIRDAIAAARAFARHRNPQQQLGIVTFNSTPSVLQPLTSDSADIRRALARTPALGRETRIYDAVGAALRMLERAHIGAGSIVVLSDGSDTGSAVSAKAIAAQADAAGVRIYAVGLRSGAFDRRVLQELAASGQGLYSEASSSAALRRIYDQLGSQLSSQYLIRYRSLAKPHTRVSVQVSVPEAGISATSFYATPALPAKATPPFERPFWETTTAGLVAAALTALLLSLSVLAIMRSRPSLRPVSSRLADFVSTARPEEPTRSSLTSRFLGGAERSLERKPWWGSFKEELEVGRIEMAPTSIVGLTAIATALAIWLLGSVTGSVLVALLGVATPFAVYAAIRQKVEHQRRLFGEQLADNLQVIASAMRAGQSFVGALATALNEAPEPVRSEFTRIVEDERIGVPIEDAMSVVARRMRNRDMEQVQLVAALQRETGGNSADVLEQVADTIRERMELRRTVQTLTAQGRLSRWVLTALPIALVLMISAINPGYLDPLLHTTNGQVILGFAAVMVVAGSLAIKRIVDIEV